MGQQVYVHKDIAEYEEKVVGKLSARVVICLGGGIAASVLAAAYAHLALGVEVADASMPVMACSVPFWLAAFWRPKGLKPEEFIPLWLDYHLEEGAIPYVSGFALALEELEEEKAPRPKGRRRLERKWRKGGEAYEPTEEQGR